MVKLNQSAAEILKRCDGRHSALASGPSPAPTIAAPLWLLAELTYRCPLHCAFCYNPVNYANERAELSTAQWFDVMRQARKLGAAQLGFSGGEPLRATTSKSSLAKAATGGGAAEQADFVSHRRQFAPDGWRWDDKRRQALNCGRSESHKSAEHFVP